MRTAGVALAWLRLDLHLRRRLLAVIALLIALSAATVLTAAAGARRGESALRRLTEPSLPATAIVLPAQEGFDWDAVRAIRQVASVAPLTESGLAFEGIDQPGQSGLYALPQNAELLRSIERPVILRGRLPDPARADEAVVTSGFVRSYGKGVGDTLVPLVDDPNLTEAASPVHRSSALPARIMIVGVIRSPLFSADAGAWGQIVLSPGLMPAYLKAVDQPFFGALVRLRDGSAGIPSFRAELARVGGAAGVDTQDLAVQTHRRQRLAVFEFGVLLGFACAALIAAVFLVGQAISRHVLAGMVQLRVLRGLGMTPWQAALAATVGPLAAAVAGVGLALPAIVLASARFPIGSAAASEPAPGIRPDGLVLAAGTVATLVAVTAVSWVTARWELRSSATPVPDRRSAVAAAAAKVGAPVWASVGARFALEPGRGRTSVPARPALLGVTIGIAGVLAAFTFASGISEAVGNPRRFGQTLQLAAFLNGDSQPPATVARLLAAAAADPDVRSAADCRGNVARVAADANTVVLFTCRPHDRPPEVVLTDGRMPESATEIVLGVETAARLGSRVGARLVLAGTGSSRAVVVTGLGFVPESWRNSHADGGWVTADGFDGLFDRADGRAVFVELRRGAVTRDVQARLSRASAELTGGDQLPFDAASAPLRSTELRQLRLLPVALGLFLVILAVGSVGHALAAAVRRRRGDVAVLRALGMTRRQCRGVVATQASVLAVVGLVFGVPLGVAVGRVVWRVVADYTPVQYAPPVAMAALVLVAPLALLAANLLAAWPGQQAARLRIAHVLRAE